MPERDGWRTRQHDRGRTRVPTLVDDIAMRAFLGLVLALVVVVGLLLAAGWIYFYDDGSRMGIGVNRDEVIQESEAIADSVSESVQQVGNELNEAGGRDRAESAPSVVPNR